MITSLLSLIGRLCEMTNVKCFEYFLKPDMPWICYYYEYINLCLSLYMMHVYIDIYLSEPHEIANIQPFEDKNGADL